MEIQSFDSAEEFTAYMERQRASIARLTEVLHPQQRAVTWGSYWVRFYEQGLVIFGKVQTVAEFITAEGIEVARIEDDHERAMATEELRESVARLTESDERGYVYGWAYSLDAVDGDLGNTHRSALWPISRDLYEHAKEHGWDPNKLRPVFELELAHAYGQYRRWAARVAERAARHHAGGEGHEPG